MRASSGNRLRQGQVVAGVLDIDPPSMNAAPPAERDAYDDVPGVFSYATGEELLAEIGNAAEPAAPAADPDADAAPATAERHLSLWERMLEALDMELSRLDDEPGPEGEGDVGKVERPTDIDKDTHANREANRQTNGNAGADSGRGRGGLRATLGELVGGAKQSRHAR